MVELCWSSKHQQALWVDLLNELGAEAVYLYTKGEDKSCFARYLSALFNITHHVYFVNDCYRFVQKKIKKNWKRMSKIRFNTTISENWYKKYKLCHSILWINQDKVMNKTKYISNPTGDNSSSFHSVMKIRLEHDFWHTAKTWITEAKKFK